MGGIGQAQSKINTVLNTYSTASRVLSTVDERVGALQDQAAIAAAAINRVAGKVSPQLAGILPSASP